jgi:glucose-1-phosphate adenylyltransferase
LTIALLLMWLTDAIPHLDLFDNDWSNWTYGEIAPPGKFMHAVDGRASGGFGAGLLTAASSPAPRSALFAVYLCLVNSYSAVRESIILHRSVSDRLIRCSSGRRYGRSGIAQCPDAASRQYEQTRG